MSSDGIPSGSVVNETVGPYLTGIMIQQLLMGVIVVQMYDYFRLFPRDSKFNKWLVSILGTISIVQTILDYLSLYRSEVTFYAQYDRFDSADWKLWSEVGITALIGAMSQAFFLERCFAATKSFIVLVIGGIAILASLGAGIAASIASASGQVISNMTQKPSSKITMSVWLASSAIIGILMSVILIIRLTRVRSEFSKTEAIITRIVRLSFTTSALTAAVTVVDIALYLGIPSAAWHFLPFFALGKIYVISVLVTLSSRKELREMMEGDGTAMTTKQAIAPSGRVDFLTTPRPTVTGIKVSTTHTYHVDRNSTSGQGDDDSDKKHPLEGPIGGTFVVHRPGGSRGSLASKRSFSSSTYNGNDLDYYASGTSNTNGDNLESHLELDLEMDVMSLGHHDNERPFAPRPDIRIEQVRPSGTMSPTATYDRRGPVVVVEEDR